MDGSTRKDHAKARFLQVREHLLKYGLANEYEFTEILGNSDSSKRGPKVTTWKMSLNVFKHYISSSQAERGYRTRAKLHQAEEELEQLAAPEPEKPEEAKPKTTSGEISVFQFPVTNQSIRVIMIDGEPWWVATDVCRELGYASNVANIIKNHCRPDGVMKHNTLTNGGMQEVTIIDERNFYRLMGRSDAPNAEPFQDWVFGTILPSILKTGGYNVNPVTQLGDEELEQLAVPEPEKPEEAEPANTQDATEDRVPAEIPDGDLVAVVKMWLQRGEQFPIDFDEIWERAGYTSRIGAREAFRKCLANFGLVEGIDFQRITFESTGGRPATTWKMTIGAAKRFLASAQTKEGYAVIEALIRAEEELQALKLSLQQSQKPLSELINDTDYTKQLLVVLLQDQAQKEEKILAQAQDIEVKTGIIKVQAETIQELAPKAAVADRLMSVEGSMFRFTESGTKVG